MTHSSSNVAGGDDFINISFSLEDNPINEAQKKDKDFYKQWVDKCMLQSTIYLSYNLNIYCSFCKA